MTRLTDLEKAMLDFAKMQAPAAPARKTFTLADLGVALVETVMRPWRRSQLAFELGRLDDRMLADIGMKRFEVGEIAEAASRHTAPTLGELLGSALSGLRRHMALAAKRRELRRELNELDDRMLRDIGVSRADIPTLVARIGAQPAEVAEMDAIDSLRVWNRSRETARTLAAMDDRQLNDIGFVRGDIDWVAEELAIRSLVPANRDAAPKAA
jgi:uncharacterized protein YjiS (DUF1127 family)